MGAGVVVVVVVTVEVVGIVVEMVVVVCGAFEVVVGCGVLEVVVGSDVVVFEVLACKKAVVPAKKSSTAFILFQFLLNNKIIQSLRYGAELCMDLNNQTRLHVCLLYNK